MSKLCIIPARGGSQRIPKKNIRDFLGKPIIAYSIKAALDSGLFDEVMVSTDDSKIAEVAMQYGAKIPFYRSKKNADHFATTFDVIEEVLREYELKGIRYEEVCCIYPCAPFVTEQILKKSHTTFYTNQYDTLFPVVAFSFPIQRALKMGENKKVEMIQKENIHVRSQDLEKSYHDAGQFYWFNPTAILAAKTFFTNKVGGHIISALNAQDIDNESDWKLAELKFKINQHSV